MNDAKATIENEAGNQRRFRASFSLRFLFLVITSIACVAAWITSCQRRAVFEAKQSNLLQEKYGAHCYYGYQVDPDVEGVVSFSNPRSRKRDPPGPKWIRRLFGDHVFARIRKVDFRTDPERFHVHPSPYDNIHQFERLKHIGEVTQLKGLRYLYLKRNGRSPKDLSGLNLLKDLRMLDMTGREVDSLPDFTGMKQLWSLNISHCRKLQSLEGLEELPKLRQLKGWYCPSLRDASALRSCTSLEDVRLSRCSFLTHLDDFSNLKSLKTLIISDTAIKNVDGLADLQCLEELTLSGNLQLANLDGLRGTVSLSKLDCNDCKGLTCIGGLHGHNSLKYLNLGSCESLKSLDGLASHAGIDLVAAGHCHSLEDISALDKNKSIRHLEVGDSEFLSDISIVKSLTGLESLVLRNNPKVTALSAVFELKQLKQLTLQNNYLQRDVQPILMFENLEQLSLSANQELRQVDGLNQLDKLTSLSLSHCPKLKNVDGLAGLSKITDLRFICNHQLVNLDGLKKMSGLKRVTIFDCPKLDVEDLRSTTPNVVWHQPTQ